MTYPFLLGLFLCLSAIVPGVCHWAHEYQFYTFKKGYISWIEENWGALVIIWCGGFAFLVSAILERFQ